MQFALAPPTTSTKAQANMTIPRAYLPSTSERGRAGGAHESSVPAADSVCVRCAQSSRLSASKLLLGALIAWCFGAASQSVNAAAAERYPITPEQRETAEKVASRGVPISDLAPGAPASYTIKRGDTLWYVATLYLKSPWRWPELWGMNRAQIHNPHLIYPGQTLVLVKTADGRAQLVLAGGAPTAKEAEAPAAAPPPPPAPAEPPAPTEKLTPRVRDLGVEAAAAIPSIPNNLIEPFLSQPIVVSASELESFPRIVATPEDRVFLGVGDIAYARGIGNDAIQTYHVFRPAEALFDPDDYERKSPIAYEALYLGTARVTKRGDVTTLSIVESKQEIGEGDRLVPIGHQELINYVPHRAEKDVVGRIVSVYGGEASVGTGSIVTLNRGRNDGLEIGTVLAVLHNGDTIVDRTKPGHEKVKLPDETIGNLFVFRVFDSISYALMVSAKGPVAIGDRFAQPDGNPVAAPGQPVMGSAGR